MKNSFLNQFSENIKFKYFCFDLVIIRGYILSMFFQQGLSSFSGLSGSKGFLTGWCEFSPTNSTAIYKRWPKTVTSPFTGGLQKGAALTGQNRSSWNKSTPIHSQERGTMSFASLQTKNRSEPLLAGNSFQKRESHMNESITAGSRSSSITSTFTTPFSVASAIWKSLPTSPSMPNSISMDIMLFNYSSINKASNTGSKKMPLWTLTTRKPSKRQPSLLMAGPSWAELTTGWIFSSNSTKESTQHDPNF